MTLIDDEDLEELLTMVGACAGVKQNPKHHPEVDLLNHLLQTYEHARRESNDFELILAALLHDVGKAVNPYNHDKIGAAMIAPIVPRKTYWLVKNHMRFWCWVTGEMRRLGKIKELADHLWLGDLALLARWDKMGRNPNKQPLFERGIILFQLGKIRDEN